MRAEDAESNPNTDMTAESIQEEVNPEPRKRSKLSYFFNRYTITAALGLGTAGTVEYQFSPAQAALGKSMANGEIFTKTVITTPPAPGPRGELLGYNKADEFTKRRQQHGDIVSGQIAWQKRSLYDFNILGSNFSFNLPPIEKDKIKAGFTMHDTSGDLFLESLYPRQILTFEEIPPVWWQSLAAIEDNKLLNARNSDKNIAVDMKRFLRGAAEHSAKSLLKVMHLPSGARTQGGTTLAGQYEKFTQWPEGATGSGKEKLIQNATATVRRYMNNKDDVEAMKEIITLYTNLVPFASVPKVGPVFGLADGYAAWTGRNFDEDAKILAQERDTPEKAHVYLEMLSFAVAVKMPSNYYNHPHDLKIGHALLNERTHNVISVAEKAGVIKHELANMARNDNLVLPDPETTAYALRTRMTRPKWLDSERLDALKQIGIAPNMFSLERMDIDYKSGKDAPVSDAVEQRLHEYNNPDIAKKVGLVGYQRARIETVPKIIWGLTLNEITKDGPITRVELDTLPPNIKMRLAHDSRLQLGSTFKGLVLAASLDMFDQLFDKYSVMSPEELATVQAKNRWTRFTISSLLNPDKKIKTAEDLKRSFMHDMMYSGNPAQGFASGGGYDHYHNFEPDENGMFNVEDAIRRSINVILANIAVDMERCIQEEDMHIDPDIYNVLGTPERTKILNHAAEVEGLVYLGRAWEAQKGKTPDQIISRLAAKTSRSPEKLAVILFAVEPDASYDRLEEILKRESAAAHPKLKQTKGKSSKTVSVVKPQTDVEDKAALAARAKIEKSPNFDKLKELAQYKSPFEAMLIYKKNYPKASDADAITFLNIISPKTREIKDYKPILRDINKYQFTMGLAQKTAKSPLDIMFVYRTLHPNATMADTLAFLYRLDSEADLTKDYAHDLKEILKAGPEKNLLSLAALDKSPDALAALYDAYNHDAVFGDFREFAQTVTAPPKSTGVKKTKTVSGPKHPAQKMLATKVLLASWTKIHPSQHIYDKHVPHKMVDVIGRLATRLENDPALILMAAYQAGHPDATYREVRAFMGASNHGIDPFKDYTSAYTIIKRGNTEERLALLVAATDRSVDELAGLYGIAHPNASFDDFKKFIQKEMSPAARQKLKWGQDFKVEYAAYGSGIYAPGSFVRSFTTDDQAFIAQIHPNAFWLQNYKLLHPKADWKEIAQAATTPDVATGKSYLVGIYKWMLEPDKQGVYKKHVQDKYIALAIQTEVYNKHILQKMQKLGYPFNDIPTTPAIVLGVTGTTTAALARFETMLLEKGMDVEYLPYEGIELGKNTIWYRKSVPGPRKAKRAMSESTAKIVRETLELVVQNGTAKDLKNGFTLVAKQPGADASRPPITIKLIIGGKTGTGDQNYGVIPNRTATFMFTIGDKFAGCITGYIMNPSKLDKFTSGMAADALRGLEEQLKPLIARAYGISPEGLIIQQGTLSPTGQIIEPSTLPKPAEPLAKSAPPAKRIAALEHRPG